MVDALRCASSAGARMVRPRCAAGDVREMPTARGEHMTTPTTTREAINAPELYGAHVLSNGDEPAAHIVDQREASGQDVAAAYILGDELVALVWASVGADS
jgi:hypothetical protein